MRIFKNLLDSFNNNNLSEFAELCESSLHLDIDSFNKLQEELSTQPDLYEVYNDFFRAMQYEV
jgi:hypothetical protein